MSDTKLAPGVLPGHEWVGQDEDGGWCGIAPGCNGPATAWVWITGGDYWHPASDFCGGDVIRVLRAYIAHLTGAAAALPTGGPADMKAPPGPTDRVKWKGRVVCQGVTLFGAVTQEGFELPAAHIFSPESETWKVASALETHRVFATWAFHNATLAARAEARAVLAEQKGRNDHDARVSYNRKWNDVLSALPGREAGDFDAVGHIERLVARASSAEARATQAEAVIVRWGAAGLLTEGQVSDALGVDRLKVREILDEEIAGLYDEMAQLKAALKRATCTVCPGTGIVVSKSHDTFGDLENPCPNCGEAAPPPAAGPTPIEIAAAAKR